jgi:hypothetical protein
MEGGRGVLSRLARVRQANTQTNWQDQRAALDAWRKATEVANGSISDDGDVTTDGATDTPGISIKAGIKQYLEAVEATKGIGTRCRSAGNKAFA